MSDVGTYRIKVCSKLSNSLKTETCSEFDYKVNPVPDVFVWTNELDFKVEFEDQKVRVGDTLVYTLGDFEGADDFQVAVTLSRGTSAKFTSFDKEQRAFRVSGDLVTRAEIGFYPIKVEVTFSDASFTKSYTRYFLLEIWDDLPQDDELLGSWFPSDPIWYPDVPQNRYIRKNFT